MNKGFNIAMTCAIIVIVMSSFWSIYNFWWIPLNTTWVSSSSSTVIPPANIHMNSTGYLEWNCTQLHGEINFLLSFPTTSGGFGTGQNSNGYYQLAQALLQIYEMKGCPA